MSLPRHLDAIRRVPAAAPASAVALALTLFATIVARASPDAGPAVRPAGAGAQEEVVLLLEDRVGVDHETDFFNRRTILTFTYGTGIITEERCSDVDPEDVVLAVTLPDGTEFVEAFQEGEPMPPSEIDDEGVATWELGTLDRSEHCFGTELAVTIEADDDVADAAALETDASISTSTEGDDPTDNEASVTFPAVMFPLEVEVLDASTECRAEGTHHESDIGDGVHCGGDPQTRSTAYRTHPPGPLGTLSAAGGAVRGRHAIHGHVLLRDNDRVDAYVRTRVEIENPNPFPVPLHYHQDLSLYCRADDGQGDVVDGEYAECGYGGVDRMTEVVYLHTRARGGPDGFCEERFRLRSGERDDVSTDETETSCDMQTVGGSTVLGFDLTGTADDRTGSFNASRRWCLATSNRDCAFRSVRLLTITGNSPVDLLLVDAQGRRVGAVDDDDLGTLSLAEIPGSSYGGAGEEPQEITLALPDPGEFHLTVLGRGEGAYTVTLTGEDDEGEVTAERTISGEATAETSLEQGLVLGSDGVFALEPDDLEAADVAAHLLGDETLEDADVVYLDLLGNENGRLDVGDVRAFLVSIGEIPPD